MIVKRGEIWLADLNPVRGSEQAGIRPVLIFQNNVLSKFTPTVLAIPLTTNLRRASLPSCVQISKGEGGLVSALSEMSCRATLLRFSKILGLRVRRDGNSSIEKMCAYQIN